MTAVGCFGGLGSAAAEGRRHYCVTIPRCLLDGQFWTVAFLSWRDLTCVVG